MKVLPPNYFYTFYTYTINLNRSAVTQQHMRCCANKNGAIWLAHSDSHSSASANLCCCAAALLCKIIALLWEMALLCEEGHPNHAETWNSHRWQIIFSGVYRNYLVILGQRPRSLPRSSLKIKSGVGNLKKGSMRLSLNIY